MRILTTEQTKQAEKKIFNTSGVSETQIIENVGKEAARLLSKDYFSQRRILDIVCLLGRGHNAADTVCLARHLKSLNYKIQLWCFFPEEDFSLELVKQIDLAVKMGIPLQRIEDMENMEQLVPPQCWIDGLMGIGLRLPLPENIHSFLHYLNRTDFKKKIFKVSMDISTGIDATTGNSATFSFPADLTLAVGTPKLGHFIGAGAERSGELKVLTNSFPPSVFGTGDLFYLNDSQEWPAYQERNSFFHKKNFGHVLVVGGSSGLSGACVMTASAALSSGAGLVTAWTWENNYLELLTRLPCEIMSGPISKDSRQWENLWPKLTHFDAVIVGPGLGRLPESRQLVLELLQRYQGPIVLDADALYHLDLSIDEELMKKRKFPLFLTPHLGEWEKIIGKSKAQMEKNPLDFMKSFCQRYFSVTILKGPCSLLTFPHGRSFFSRYPNAGMAKGGSGDVYAGILGGLLAQEYCRQCREETYIGVDFFEKAVTLSLLVHAFSGQFATDKHGVFSTCAHHQIEHFGQAFAFLKSIKESNENSAL